MGCPSGTSCNLDITAKNSSDTWWCRTCKPIWPPRYVLVFLAHIRVCATAASLLVLGPLARLKLAWGCLPELDTPATAL